jgi:putative phosphonate catabolism associated alcohol dehydrogenase
MKQETCNAAVFMEVGKPLAIRRFELPRRIEPGAALCKVSMSTICGSDLHTINGRRTEPAPLILGHEIIGRIVELGDDLARDGFGEELKIGDRVSWSIAASCGNCRFCRLGLPQKCEHLRKYGHTCCEQAPYLTGGFAEYIYLFPGTTVFKVPDNLPDEVAAPANCALSTVVNAMDSIEIHSGDHVLIQGAGLLGLNLVALAVEAGAAGVIVTDVTPHRLQLASQFGATFCLNISELGDEETLNRILRATENRGVDVALEVCGDTRAADQAIQALRIGGRYLIAGMVTPNSHFRLDGNQITRKCLTIKGIHNYKPEHLGRALLFLKEHSRKYPYSKLVGKSFPLEEINEAVALAGSGQYVRIGIIPG